MKKKIKYGIIVLIMIMLNLTTIVVPQMVNAQTRPVNTAQAAPTTTGTVSTANIPVNNFGGETTDPNKKSSRAVIGISRNIIELLQLIGIGIALVMLVIIGIRYIINADKEKPNIKQVALNYVFGAFCIFGATTILTFIQRLVVQFKDAV